MKVDYHQMKPGDLLEYRCPRYGIVWQWRVLEVALGGEREESLIRVSSVMAHPQPGEAEVMVPEPMTRMLKIVRPSEGGQ